MTKHEVPPVGSYAEHSTRRWVPEPPKPVTRDHFARDRARVVHSSALRRLGGKTQVVGPFSDDFARTRLTHSIEVAQVGREIARALGAHPDVVDAACLAHDVGHPPFGHHGEAVLDHLAENIGGFEGNAQSLRLLTRLEPKVMAPADHPRAGGPAGLNLTRASLDACIKYPWAVGENPDKPSKFGYYADDADVFAWIREGAPVGRRCVEAQVMDLADDIAYSVHDVEDAIVGGWLDPAVFTQDAHRDTVCGIAVRFEAGRAAQDMDEALTRLQRHPLWLEEFAGSRADLARLKDLTSQLIGRFAVAARHATGEAVVAGPAVRYDAEVVMPADAADEIAVLKAIAVQYVMNHETRQAVYDAQEQVLTELVEGLCATGKEHLEPSFAADYDEQSTDDGRLRVVIDQVAVLTDASAVALHKKLAQTPRV